MSRVNPVAAAKALSKKQRDRASQVWAIAYSDLIARVEALSAKRRPKSFEVHHALETSRAAFLGQLVAGANLDACREAALQAFPKKW